VSLLGPDSGYIRASGHTVHSTAKQERTQRVADSQIPLAPREPSLPLTPRSSRRKRKPSSHLRSIKMVLVLADHGRPSRPLSTASLAGSFIEPETT